MEDTIPRRLILRVPRSSSREVRIRVPTGFYSIFQGNSPPKKLVKGTLEKGHQLLGDLVNQPLPGLRPLARPPARFAPVASLLPCTCHRHGSAQPAADAPQILRTPSTLAPTDTSARGASLFFSGCPVGLAWKRETIKRKTKLYVFVESDSAQN